MLSFLGLSKLQFGIYIAIFLAFVGLGGWWHIRGQTIDNLNLRIESMQKELDTANERIRLNQRANEILEETLRTQREQSREVNQVIRNLRNHERSNDEVNPILREAFDQIQRLRERPRP